LSRADIERAAACAGAQVVGCVDKGSRSRARAFEVGLSGSGISSGQRGGLDHRAATWDEWRITLAYLFRLDPAMHCGKVYESEAHFVWATDGRYRHLTPAGQHIRHRWKLLRHSATGVYFAQECNCGAVRRYPSRGHTWSEIDGAPPSASTPRRPPAPTCAGFGIETRPVSTSLDTMIAEECEAAWWAGQRERVRQRGQALAEALP
jgi:hypothetical protein